MNFPEIERKEIDLDAIQQFSSESEFIGVSVDLLIEAGSHIWTGISAGIRDVHK